MSILAKKSELKIKIRKNGLTWQCLTFFYYFIPPENYSKNTVFSCRKGVFEGLKSLFSMFFGA